MGPPASASATCGSDSLDALDERASYELLRFLSRLGHVLLATGDTVGVVEDTLRRVARAHGLQHVNVVALPTVLMVKFDDGVSTRVDFTSEEGVTLRFDQIEAVFALAHDAEQKTLTPAEGLQRLTAILTQPPQFSLAWSVAGHVLATVGIALVLQPTPGVIGSAAFFGLIVGVLKLLARNRGLFATLLPTIAAFIVSVVAIEAARHGFPASPLRVLIASLVTFLPGGLLAIATMDLAYGDVVSGASRFVLGLVQLVFIMLGMLTATSLVGLPPDTLFVAGPDVQLGAWATWLGVLLFGVGLVLHYSAPLRTLPWMLFVLFVAAAGQYFGNAAFGGYMSAFIGALAITPVAYLLQYRLGGPPAMVTFTPALWLLVPGALGLLGVAELVGDNHLAGLESFVTTLFTIVAIAVGSLLGSGIYNSLFDPIFRRAGTMADFMRQRLRWKR